jgi:hypothetical protein
MDGGEDVVRIGALVLLLPELPVGLAVEVEVLRPDRGRADVERQEAAQ